MNKPNSLVAGAAISSPSLLSEPPDIRNWFTSYTYQSPELDSNEDFCISPTRVDEGEYEEEGLYVEDSEDEKVEDCVNLTKIKRALKPEIGHMKNGCLSIARKSTEEARKREVVLDADEIPAYPDSLPPPSELPDIANWFASYAYESPELDSADFDVSLSLNHAFSNSEMVDKENSEHYKEVTMKAKVESLSSRELISNSSEMNARSPGTKNSEKHSTAQKHILERNNFSSVNNSCPEITSEASTQGTPLGDCSITADEPVRCRKRKAENLMTILQDELQTNEADHLLISAKTPCREAFTETCEYVTQNISHVSDNDSGWIQLNRKSQDAYCKRSKPDDKQCILTENGLTSLMKNTTPRINDENSLWMLGPKKCNIDRNIINSVSSCEDKRAGEVTREVFKETTNTQYPYAQEAAGKWRCPQKNKPNTGPPLKQLRLERWVRRI